MAQFIEDVALHGFDTLKRATTTVRYAPFNYDPSGDPEKKFRESYIFVRIDNSKWVSAEQLIEGINRAKQQFFGGNQ